MCGVTLTNQSKPPIAFIYQTLCKFQKALVIEFIIFTENTSFICAYLLGILYLYAVVYDYV